MTRATEDHIWLRGIINSADNYFKLKTADLVVTAFKEQYPEEKDLHIVLIDLVNDRYQDFLKIKPS